MLVWLARRVRALRIRQRHRYIDRLTRDGIVKPNADYQSVEYAIWGNNL